MNSAIFSLEANDRRGNTSKPVQAASISAKIRRDTHKFLVTGRNYNGTTDWLTNAKAQMATRPFHAIIATQNPGAVSEVLVAGEFAKDDAPFKVKPQDNIPRRAAELAQCASLLVCHSDEIQFVDPYFDPSEPRWRNTFKSIVSMRCASAGKLKVLEVHRAKPDPFIAGVQESNFTNRLADIVPSGVKLRVFFWSEKPSGQRFHARYLLTDLGGFNFETGLDEGNSGETTLVTPLLQDNWQKCRTDYAAAGTTFAITQNCILEINGCG